MLMRGLRPLRNLLQDSKAVTALEYALIAGLVALAIIGAVTKLGTNLSTKFYTISTNL